MGAFVERLMMHRLLVAVIPLACSSVVTSESAMSVETWVTTKVALEVGLAGSARVRGQWLSKGGKSEQLSDFRILRRLTRLVGARTM